jgi:hypothetical protein
MDQWRVDIGFLLEPTLMGEIYSWHSLNYNVLALTAKVVELRGDYLLVEGQ